MYLAQKLSFSGSFRVSNRCSVGCFGDYDIRSKFVNPCSTKMSICSHVIITRVYNRLTVALDVKHTSSQNMASIICRDLDVSKLESLVELNCLNFVNTVLNHFSTETIHFILLSDSNFSKVLKHQRYNSFSGWCRYNGTTVSNSLAEVGQRAAMIKMKVSD